MDLTEPKKEFGKTLCFWGGGIEVQQVLPFASLDEIAKEVERNIDVMAVGGGYIFALTHNIQPGVLMDRLDKVYETARTVSRRR